MAAALPVLPSSLKAPSTKGIMQASKPSDG